MLSSSDSLEIIPIKLLEEYLTLIPKSLEVEFNALSEAEISNESFSFYTSVASVFSSKIEGEEIELDSYVKHKRFGVDFLPDYTKRTDDLYDAYLYANVNPLIENNVAEIHKILTAHILQKHQQGIIRNSNMYILSPDGKIDYVAAKPFEVEDEMKKLYSDIHTLIQQNLSTGEIFFYAAMIHLVFVKIHPWSDGNGRSARLLEKWFLAQKLGSKAWFVQSEKYYYKNLETYYSNIKVLGLEYQNLEYSKAMPFLLMLPNSIL